MRAATPLDLLVLSPHLDDAVLSLGSYLHARRSSGARVLVATVFTADEPAVCSPLAMQLHRLWRLTPPVVAKRRREDEAALAQLDVAAVHLPLAEAIYRTASGDAAFARVADLFHGELAPALPPALLDALGHLPEATVVAAPLGAGGHVDHRLVRRAAEELFAGRLLYYEDLPYATRLLAVRRTLAGARRDWRRLRLEASAGALAAKATALAAYRSQLPSLFGGEASMRRWVDRLEYRRGERLWWRNESAPPGWPATAVRG